MAGWEFTMKALIRRLFGLLPSREEKAASRLTRLTGLLYEPIGEDPYRFVDRCSRCGGCDCTSPCRCECTAWDCPDEPHCEGVRRGVYAARTREILCTQCAEDLAS